MAIYYKFQKTPRPKDGTTARDIHMRVVTKETVTTDVLCHKISHRSTLTEADVKAVLSALSHVLVEELSDSNNVQLEGLGTFSTSITGSCMEDAIGRFYPVDAKVRTVLFRPERKLVQRIGRTKFKPGVHFAGYEVDETELTAFLTDFFSRNEAISSGDLHKAFALTAYASRKLLARLVDEGRLKKVGRGNLTSYMPQPGYFGK